MPELFDEFPFLENDRIIIRKMDESDVDALKEITDNDNVYRFIPPFLHNKSRGNLLTAIKNLGGRDFDKKKVIIAGVYEKNSSGKLVGLAEMFDYKKRTGRVTIGYRINESCWNRGIALNIVSLLVGYLSDELQIPELYAHVMPENIYSAKALLKNGFVRLEDTVEEVNWGGLGTAVCDVYLYKRQ